MENQRALLFAALTFVLFLIWQAWQDDYVNNESTAPQTVSTPANIDVPDTTGASEAISSVVPNTEPQKQVTSRRNVKVNTDVYSLEIDTKGATIHQLDLLQYPLEKGKEEIVNILNHEQPKIFMVESGLISNQIDSPNHHSVWTTDKNEYTLTDNRMDVPFYWENEAGVKVVKTYTFTKGSYRVDVSTRIENNSSDTIETREYVQLKRNGFTEAKQNSMIITFTGGVLYNEEDKYQKIDFDEFQDKENSRDAVGGWLAYIQHYFVVSWVPQSNDVYRYYTKEVEPGLYVIGAFSPNKRIFSGESETFSTSLFAGPKIQKQLDEVGEGLGLTVDFGKLTIIADPIFWLLSQFYDLVGNWGVAIILVTLTIKALFYKLSEKSYRSMAQMKLVQPRIVTLKERYGDDKQKLNQAMMDLYKTEKINPLGGCLPILVQIPVFSALYWVLLESVELRQAPFMLWMDNLSAPDPFFILPVLYGITMFIQQKLNPAPVDPMQKKIMQSLPVVFTAFFAFFPSGLVLYWIVNNVLTIAQQSFIMRRVEADNK
jgi:YidC/Oxa1 family membrane protein insertase